MVTFPKLDFREATRLVRAGRLAEAASSLIGAGAGSGATSGPDPSPWFAERSARSAEARAGALPVPVFGPFGALLSPGADVRRMPDVPPGARFEDRVYANEAGMLAYKVYVPSGYAGRPLPLVVMLHGCTQSPDDFAAGTRMNEWAERKLFLVAYPAQRQSANLRKCWNWYKADEQQRDEGEPSLIAGVTRQVIEEFSADPARVYVAGLSAGGAEAAVMAATYPDLFAAVGIHSGIAYGAALDMHSALTAMNGGAAASAPEPRRSVPAIVFHGDEDKVVHPVNAERIIAQAAHGETLRKKVIEGETPDGMRYTRTVQTDAYGRDILEQWSLHGAGHAWSGGSSEGSFADPRGPDASREMIRFFLAHRNAG